MRKLVLILLVILLLAGCSSPASYQKISAAQAQQIMDGPDEYILLDVRTESEFMAGHIAGAILIPDNELAQRAPAELPDKNALILVYCRSGNRSQKAAQQLLELGYRQVYDFGGILDWPGELVQ